jgi:hypothetical protein
VRSLLEFSSQIWSPQYEVHKQLIERIQKIFVKHLSFRQRIRLDSYMDSINHFKMDTLESRRVLLDMRFLYDIMRGGVDSFYLTGSISIHVPLPRRTRRNVPFHVDTFSSNYTRNSVINRLLETYNDRFDHLDIFAMSRGQFAKAVAQTMHA